MYQTYPNYSGYFQPGAGAVTSTPSPPPPMQQRFPQQVALKGRPVSSVDEVRGTSIDFDGSVFYFPDVANKRIYTKQINIDGTSSIQVYELKNIPLDAGTGNYVTREEFDTTMVQLKQVLDQMAQAQQVQQETQKQNNIVSQF